MSSKFDFNDLFVFDLANNHQGMVDHGKRIIREVSQLAKKNNLKAAIKFQFRQLDTFIHPDYQDRTDIAHIPRFMSTRLSQDQFQELLDEIKKEGMLSMCTPFDEESVDVIEKMGFDIIKVASASAKDWPLLEQVAGSGLPVVCSTGGTTINEIDNLNSFFKHRGVHFAFMHCVSIYPIPDHHMQLNVIDELRARYPGVTIGWSTHEDPNDTLVVAMAVAKGARMFERHVGAETDEIKLNKYSSRNDQLDAWIDSYKRAVMLCGPDQKKPAPEEELESLQSLNRGVFLKGDVEAGAKLTRDDVFFAMPQLTSNQLPSGQWKEGITVHKSMKANEPVLLEDIHIPEEKNELILKKSIHDVIAMINIAKIPLSPAFDVEFSHHYGIENFHETGAVIITLINRSYAKKLVVQLPGQHHPNHFHKRKEETFQVLSGSMYVKVDNHERFLLPGDTCLVQPGVWHSFWSEEGCVFEEISTKHYNDDSFYEDKRIAEMDRSQRKTEVDHWGRFQLGNPEMIQGIDD